MEKVWCGFRHAPSPVLPLREPKPIHSDSATQQSVHSSCQVFAVFLQLLVINLKWLASFIRAISTLKNHFVIFCVSSGRSCGIVWYSFLLFWYSMWHSIWHSILAFYSASFWHPIWHPFWYLFWNFSGILSGICSDILSGIYSDILFWHSIWHLFWHSLWHVLRSGTAHWDVGLGIRVRQCPLRSGVHGLRPAVTNWNLELAVEVRQCPLRSGARGSGLAVDN